MVEASHEMRPIRIFGAALILFSLVGTWVFFSPLSPAYFFTFFAEISDPGWMLAFILGNTLFYLLTGLGVIVQKKWGYWFLKLWLYMLFLAFPIGTVISYMFLRYIKKHEIKRYFG
jgi:hypothetical protein